MAVRVDTDFLSQRQLRQKPQYIDVMAGEHTLHDVAVSLPAAPGRFRRLVLTRDLDRPFNERDRRLLGLLRPHLREIWDDSQLGRAKAPQLTPREWEVLHLVSAGLSNASIAAHLIISVATVRKHLENIYDRLGVRTRTTAAAIAFPSHLAATRPGSATPAMRQTAPRPHEEIPSARPLPNRNGAYRRSSRSD
jgi:ATP/maltotriose-dependent transcriptional regulator MalT